LSVGYKTAFFFLISPFLISAKRHANSILLFYLLLQPTCGVPRSHTRTHHSR
jgi:hypothetical protein